MVQVAYETLTDPIKRAQYDKEVMKRMGYNVKSNSVSQPTPNPQPEKRKERKPEENKPEKKF